MASENKAKTEKDKKVKKTTTKSKQKKESFFKQIIKEMKLVKWPTFKEIFKYTVATILFVLIICGFFFVLYSLLTELIRGLS